MAPEDLLTLVGGLVLGLYGGGLGQGTGVLGLPLLVDLVGTPFALARSVCLLGNIPLSGAAVLRHRKAGRSLQGIAPVLVGMLVGVAGGVGLQALVSVRGLWIIYAVFLGTVFASFFLKRRLTDMSGPERPWAALVVGAAAGLFCGSIGVGGGALMVPGLALLARVPLKRCMILSSGAIIIGSLAGLALNWQPGTLRVIGWMLPGLVGGAWFGASIGQRLKDTTIRNIFVVVVLVVFVKTWMTIFSMS